MTVSCRIPGSVPVKHPTRPRALTAAAVAIALLAAACTSDDTGAAPSGPAAPTSTDADPPGTHTISPDTSTPQVAAPSTAAPATDPPPPTPADFSAVDPIVTAAIAEHDLNGAALVVVDRGEGVVHEQYWGEFGPERISLIASSSKMIVAGVLLALDDAGLLDIDAPVAEAVDWAAGNPTITPAQLVSNSSGLVGLGPNPAYVPYLCQFLPIGSLQDCGETIFTTTADDDAVIEPDTEFRYGGGQWQVAGAVAETVSGRSWDDLIESTYAACDVDSLGFNNQWTQFGLVGFDYPEGFGADPASLAPTDNPNIEGGAYITAPDYADLLLMLLRGGRCGDEQVLSAAAVERMLADRIGDVYGGSDNGLGYGMGWFVDRTTGLRSDPGAYGTVPWLDLEAGHGAFLVIEDRGDVGRAIAGQLDDVVDAALANS